MTDTLTPQRKRHISGAIAVHDSVDRLAILIDEAIEECGFTPALAQAKQHAANTVTLAMKLAIELD